MATSMLLFEFTLYHTVNCFCYFVFDLSMTNKFNPYILQINKDRVPTFLQPGVLGETVTTSLTHPLHNNDRGPTFLQPGMSKETSTSLTHPSLACDLDKNSTNPDPLQTHDAHNSRFAWEKSSNSFDDYQYQAIIKLCAMCV